MGEPSRRRAPGAGCRGRAVPTAEAAVTALGEGGCPAPRPPAARCALSPDFHLPRWDAVLHRLRASRELGALMGAVCGASRHLVPPSGWWGCRYLQPHLGSLWGKPGWSCALGGFVGAPRTSTGVGLRCGGLTGRGGRRGQAAQRDPSWTALRSLPGCAFPPLPGAGLETRWLCVLPACGALEGGAELDSAEPGAGGAAGK